MTPTTAAEVVEDLKARGFDAHITPCGDASVTWASTYWVVPYIDVVPNGTYTLVWSRTGYPPYPSRTWDEVVDSLNHFRMIWGCRPYPYSRRAPSADIAYVLGAVALVVLVLFVIL